MSRRSAYYQEKTHVDTDASTLRSYTRSSARASCRACRPPARPRRAARGSGRTSQQPHVLRLDGVEVERRREEALVAARGVDARVPARSRRTGQSCATPRIVTLPRCSRVAVRAPAGALDVELVVDVASPGADASVPPAAVRRTAVRPREAACGRCVGRRHQSRCVRRREASGAAAFAGAVLAKVW